MSRVNRYILSEEDSLQSSSSTFLEMVHQVGNSRRKYKVGALSAGLIIAGGYLVLKTFPHLKESLFSYLSHSKKDDSDSNEPVNLNENTEAGGLKQVDEDMVVSGNLLDISEWSEKTLREWLKEKEVFAPQDASVDDLISLVKSINQTK